MTEVIIGILLIWALGLFIIARMGHAAKAGDRQNAKITRK